VLGHAEASGEREVLVRKGGKVKGYAAVPTVEREEDVPETDDVEGKIVIRVRPTKPPLTRRRTNPISPPNSMHSESSPPHCYSPSSSS
jgi:hypothetical protein